MKKFENFISNLFVLSTAKEQDLENEFIMGGIIDKFSLQFELGWKVLKELLKYEGINTANTGSPREIIKAAYKVYDFINEDIWLSMLKKRNDVTHIYNENSAKNLVNDIIDIYIPEFINMKNNILIMYSDIIDNF